MRMVGIKILLVLMYGAMLSSCGTTYIWTHKHTSPIVKECRHRATVFHGVNNDFYFMSEFSGVPGMLPILDVPFSFVGDVLLVPISVPLYYRDRRECARTST